MTNKLLTLVAFCFLFFLFGCKKKEGPAGPQGPAGPTGPGGLAYYGVIAGHVVLYDQYGVRRNHDLDGVKVFLNDSVSTLTDTNGYYYFNSVGSGNYNITASLEGYGNTRGGFVPFVKDSLFKNLGLSQKPGFSLASFTANNNPGDGYNSLVATFDSDPRTRKWIVFLSNSPSVDSAHYLLAYSATIAINVLTGTIRVNAASLNNAGINSGAVVYYKAYSYAVNDASAYLNQATGDTIYTAVGTSISDTTIAP